MSGKNYKVTAIGLLLLFLMRRSENKESIKLGGGCGEGGLG